MTPEQLHKFYNPYALGDPAGYTVEIPFAGGGGAKTYTLVFEE